MLYQKRNIAKQNFLKKRWHIVMHERLVYSSHAINKDIYSRKESYFFWYILDILCVQLQRLIIGSRIHFELNWTCHNYREEMKKKTLSLIRNKSRYYYLVPKHNTISACLQCFSAGFISFGGNASCTYNDIRREIFRGKHK